MKATSNLWEMSYSAVQDTSSKGQKISKFVERQKGEAFTFYYDLTLKSSVLDIADKVAGFFKNRGFETTIKSDETKWLAIEAVHWGNAEDEAFAIVADEDRRDDMPANPKDLTASGILNTPRIGHFSITAVADRALLQALFEFLTNEFKSERFGKVNWWYDEGGRTTYKTIYLENPNTIVRPEFYPNLGMDPEDYINAYLKSDCAVLMMAGPPGTGKTTLLRHMIYEHNLTASVVYDEHLMEKDTVFQSFLFDKDEDVLVVEDADVILTTRDLGTNKLMSRFLNVSDGLIKLPNKKLVFTTNLADFSKVDEALVRPGRCFDVLQTRPLNHTEAIAAAKAANLPIPIEPREYTVAELFNQGRKNEVRRRVGFNR